MQFAIGTLDAHDPIDEILHGRIIAPFLIRSVEALHLLRDQHMWAAHPHEINGLVEDHLVQWVVSWVRWAATLPQICEGLARWAHRKDVHPGVQRTRVVVRVEPARSAPRLTLQQA